MNADSIFATSRLTKTPTNLEVVRIVHGAILFLALTSHSLVAPAISIGPAPPGFQLEGAVQEWIKQRSALKLFSKGAGSRPGKIWLAQSPRGLVIAGKVEGPPPVFAKSPEDMPNGDHVEIWVAIADKVALPSIGAYGMEGAELHSVADCEHDINKEDCKTWFAHQEAHRRLLPRLFVRQWQLAPGVAVETYARSALEEMRKEARDRYQYLSPKGLPEIRFAAKLPKGYEFEALIPWEAMSPSDRLSLDQLRVMVDVFSRGGQGKYGAFSTTSPNRRYGAVDTLNQVSLTPPRSWHLSRCDYPLAGKNFWARVGSENAEVSNSLPAYFLPDGKEEVTASFVLDNEWFPKGTFSFNDPQAISPVVEITEFFSQQLSPGLSICGTELAVRRGDRVSYGKNLKIEANPMAKKVPGGWLVKGAWFGEFRDPLGQCGACEDVYLNLHFVPDLAGAPQSAFQMSGIAWDCCGDYGIEEITLSDDFKRIRVVGTSGNEDRKIHEYCFDTGKHVYLECLSEEKKRPISANR
jgi:hypothetical protein